MQPLVFADVRISYAEFQRLNQQFALRQRWYRFLLLPVMVTAGLWYGLSDAQGTVSTGAKILASAGLSVLTLAYAAFNFRRTLKKQYQASPLLQHPVTYTITDEGITVESPIWRGANSWQVLQGFRRVGGWYLLATSAAGGFFLNPACLLAPATEADLVQLLLRKGLRQL